MADFERFFAQEYAGVVRAVTLAFGDRDLAEDAVQDGFARAYERWSSVSSMDRPTAWVYVVAANRARDRLRRLERVRRVTTAPAVEPRIPDPTGGVALALSVRAAIDALPARQRQAVVLRFLADLTIEETASAMGCAAGTVKSTLHAALRALRVGDVRGADGEEAS